MHSGIGDETYPLCSKGHSHENMQTLVSIALARCCCRPRSSHVRRLLLPAHHLDCPVFGKRRGQHQTQLCKRAYEPERFQHALLPCRCPLRHLFGLSMYAKGWGARDRRGWSCDFLSPSRRAILHQGRACLTGLCTVDPALSGRCSNWRKRGYRNERNA